MLTGVFVGCSNDLDVTVEQNTTSIELEAYNKENDTKEITVTDNNVQNTINDTLVSDEGSKEYTNKETANAFRDAGLSHILALSGMHLSKSIGVLGSSFLITTSKAQSLQASMMLSSSRETM